VRAAGAALEGDVEGTMIRKFTGLGIALVLAVAPAAAAERWLHVLVVEDEGQGETVRVNLPLSTIESLLPLVKAEGLEGGRLRLTSEQTEGVDLRKAWQALRTAPDGDFVTVDGTDGRVRVSRSGSRLVAHVDDAGSGEKVRVMVPVAVLDALFSGDGEEVDLVAAVRALGDHADGDLVQVEDGDSRVRIWIDADQDGRGSRR
jgi:hypothetical protein